MGHFAVDFPPLPLALRDCAPHGMPLINVFLPRHDEQRHPRDPEEEVLAVRGEDRGAGRPRGGQER